MDIIDDSKLNVMLDLETMSTANNAAIVSIGACLFSSNEKANIYNFRNTFYRVIDLQSCVDAGLVIDASTVIWWLQQAQEAREAITEIAHPLKLSIVLQDFSHWVMQNLESRFNSVDAVNVCMWGNGTMFDNVILNSAYAAVGMLPPWTRKGDYCYRTIKNKFPDYPIEQLGTLHNAKDDAVSQAEHLIQLHNLARVEQS
jgi:hypothetical protein